MFLFPRKGSTYQMKIFFIRHGEPDYVHDCLTEAGKRQADGAARRLETEGIQSIFSSPNGRAMQTAQPLCGLLGLSMTVLPFMHEIDWGGENVPEGGHPWTLGSLLLTRENWCPTVENWEEHPFFKNNIAREYVHSVGDAFDRFLLEHGYERDGNRYLCHTEKEETAAIFYHGGSGACVLSRLLNLPFPWVCAVMPYDFTSVTAITLDPAAGQHVFARLSLFNDCAHWKKNQVSPIFDK